jgi:hypothetical protein
MITFFSYQNAIPSVAKFNFPPMNGTRFAYVWYATQASYLCSALVALKIIKRKRENSNFPYPVDYVLVHAEGYLAGGLHGDLIKLWEAEGGIHRGFKLEGKQIKTHYYKGLSISHV